MQTFETIVIFNPEITSEIKLNKYSNIVQRFTGAEYKAETNTLGIKQLAYEIKDKTKGYYAQFLWRGTPNDVLELERYLRIDDEVLKFMTVKASKELEQQQPDSNDSSDLDLFDLLYNIKN